MPIRNEEVRETRATIPLKREIRMVEKMEDFMEDRSETIPEQAIQLTV